MLKEKIAGAVEGVKVWYDPEVMRLNHEGQGELLGEFLPDERVLVVNPDGTYFLANTNYALRFDVQPLLVEKFNPHKVFSAVYFDGEQKQYYLKRFRFEPTEKTQSFIPDEYSSKLIALNADVFPALKLVFGGKNANREPENIDVDAFIAVKGYKAKGKRLTTFDVKRVEFIEPLEKERSAFEEETSGIPDSESEDNDSGSSAEQMSLEL